MSQHSKVSVITYDHNAVINFQNKSADPSLINQLQFLGGGTDFNNPLQRALEIMQRFLSNFDKFQVFFLTDGIAAYPETGTKAIIAN